MVVVVLVDVVVVLVPAVDDVELAGMVVVVEVEVVVVDEVDVLEVEVVLVVGGWGLFAVIDLSEVPFTPLATFMTAVATPTEP